MINSNQSILAPVLQFRFSHVDLILNIDIVYIDRPTKFYSNSKKKSNDRIDWINRINEVPFNPITGDVWRCLKSAGGGSICPAPSYLNCVFLRNEAKILILSKN